MPQQRRGTTRTHNEWFQTTVAMRCDCGSNRKSRTLHHQDLQVCIWGEYVYGKWRTVQKVCQACFQSKVIPQLIAHAAPCGCSFSLQARSGHSLPPWITLDHTGLGALTCTLEGSECAA